MAVAVLALGGLFVALRPDPSAEGLRERTVELTIEGGAMSSPEVTVGEGDRVDLRITADRPVELHLHGYDLEGWAATLAYQADDPVVAGAPQESASHLHPGFTDSSHRRLTVAA